MRPRLVLPLILVALAAIGVAGCGEDEKDQFVEDYKPLNDKLLAIGRDLGKGLREARGKSNKQLSQEFAAYALRLEKVGEEIEDLDTPKDLEDDSNELTEKIDATVKSLEEISGAAGTNDPQGAAAATVELGTNSQELNQAQNKLAKATGAAKGAS